MPPLFRVEHEGIKIMVKLHKEDFVKDGDGFEIEVVLFDEESTNIGLEFPENCDPVDYLKEKLPVVESRLNWIVSNKAAFVDFLAVEGNLEAAQEWGGDLDIEFPITAETFGDAMVFNSLSMDFGENEDNPPMEIYIEFEPDFFGGHCLRVEVTEDDELDGGEMMG